MGPGRRAGDSGQPWRGYDPSKVERHWAIPDALKAFLPNSGSTLKIQQQLDQLYEIGEIYISKHGRPKYKQRPTNGVGIQDIWSYQPGTEGALWDNDRPIDYDVKWLDNEIEKLGYPTQKPLGLLERIIAASSNPGDVVLDPFCGCGTAVHAAQKLGRRWIGIDVTHLAISLIERRLKDAFEAIAFEVQGTPKDFEGARDLAARDKNQFQWWAVSLVDAVPQGGVRKKGMDRGIDGIRWVRTGPKQADIEQVVVSVKGGENVTSGMVRDLKGTMERERAAAGLFVTLAEPTREMLREASSAGLFETSFGRHPKIQILTIKALLAGVKPDLPMLGRGEGFRRAPKERGKGAEQIGMDL